MSQEAAASACRVSTSTVRNAERGVAEPKASTVARMALLYGVDWRDLFHTPEARTTPGKGGLSLGSSRARSAA